MAKTHIAAFLPIPLSNAERVVLNGTLVGGSDSNGRNLHYTSAESGRAEKELAAEAVMEELGSVASMAVSNFVKAIHLAAIRAASPSPVVQDKSTIKSKRAIKFDDEA